MTTDYPIVRLADLRPGEDGLVLLTELFELPESIDSENLQDNNGPEWMGDDWHWTMLLDEAEYDEQYEAVVASLIDDGQLKPLTVGYDGNRPDGSMVFGDGHHRIAAMRELDWKYAWVHHSVDGFNGWTNVDDRVWDGVAHDSGQWFDNEMS